VPSGETISNDLIGQRQERARLAFDLLALGLRSSANGIPIFDARRRISGAAILAFPTHGVDIISAAKEAAKQRDLFRCRGFL